VGRGAGVDAGSERRRIAGVDRWTPGEQRLRKRQAAVVLEGTKAGRDVRYLAAGHGVEDATGGIADQVEPGRAEDITHADGLAAVGRDVGGRTGWDVDVVGDDRVAKRRGRTQHVEAAVHEPRVSLDVARVRGDCDVVHVGDASGDRDPAAVD